MDRWNASIAAGLYSKARAILFSLVALGLGVMCVQKSQGDPADPRITPLAQGVHQNEDPGMPAVYQMGAGQHIALAGEQPPVTGAGLIPPKGTGEDMSPGEVTPPAAPASPSSGLVINATFDSTITSNPNSAAIQSTINQAIAIYQSLFRDPMTVSILFRYDHAGPDGSVMVPAMLARSDYVVYTITWSTYLNALKSDAKTGNDANANASLPAQTLSTYVSPSSASGRAVGLYTPPAMFPDGAVANGGPYDGIVTLNSGSPLQFTRPTASNKFDALRTTQHEIDEVLGLGSHIGSTRSGNNFLRPQDLFTWSSAGVRNITGSGNRYLSLDGGNSAIVSMSQTAGYDYGDWLSTPCPQTNPYVQNANGCMGQASDISQTSAEGINLDVIGYDLGLPAPAAAELLNISTRLNVLTDDNVLIGGFIITGNAPKKVMLRGLGPSLGVTGALADPTMELHFPDGSVVPNNNWKINDQTGQSQEAEIRATTIPPSNNLESAMVQTLAPGSYTVIVKGINGGTGIGLVEAYDLDQASPSKLANISTRGFVDAGDNVMIGGFIVGPDAAASTKIVVRGMGPSLPFASALQDPTLELHDGNGAQIASNDNWAQDSGAIEIQADKLAPKDPRESALLRVLAPGSYTAILAGKDGATGLGLIEVYNVP